ncbi:NAD dependent epimerase/dehydratase [Byssothecium circinans]|uniref:NAD dependent epimerase/dehydratase n=1 Tax=Byssothecium circinans TaxID=147558 RepID=A0A6A5TQ18_9PLEO|nr:NAD dependent epimerase/dehydratase [Byssothecium circinans]
MAPQVQDPLLSVGSLVLVTAANGLIASHIVDQLLHYGHAVRGTVRSHSRCAWMTPLFQQRHPNSHLELVEISDIGAAGCYDSALKGVSAVIHTAADTSLSDDPDAISKAVNANLNILKAAKDANSHGEKIKRVVLTSSSWAVFYPQPNVKKELTHESYDTHAAQDPNTPKEFRGLVSYVASKTRAEQEGWAWFKENVDCGFTLNTVNPDTCMGPVLSPKDQAYPSTVGFIRSLYEGKNAELFDWLEPQWFVDVRDAARLHVAGAILNGVEGERIFGYAETFTWPGVAKVVEQEMGQKVPIQLKDKGEDLTTAPAQREKSVQLLNRLGRNGWVPFEESVRANIRCFYPKA